MKPLLLIGGWRFCKLKTLFRNNLRNLYVLHGRLHKIKGATGGLTFWWTKNKGRNCLEAITSSNSWKFLLFEFAELSFDKAMCILRIWAALRALSLSGTNPKHTIRDGGSNGLLTAYTAYTVYKHTLLFILFKLPCTVACMPIYNVEKVRTLMEWAAELLSKMWEWVSGLDGWYTFQDSYIWLLEHLWC